MSELKPCPFCGGEDLKFNYFSTPAYWVICKTCGVKTAPHGGDGFSFNDAKAMAIFAWNTRTDDKHISELQAQVGAANLAAEIFQADCEKKDKRIAELEQLPQSAALACLNGCKHKVLDKRIAELEAQLVLANKESSANVENALNHYSRAKQAEAQVDAVRRYSNKCAILRVEPTTKGLKQALEQKAMSDVKFMVDMIYDDVVHITPERYKEFTKAEAQVDRVRNEYLNHVRADKTPVMVLDAIGWILEDKALQEKSDAKS